MPTVLRFSIPYFFDFFITPDTDHLPGQSQGQGLRRHSAPLRGPLTLARQMVHWPGDEESEPILLCGKWKG